MSDQPAVRRLSVTWYCEELEPTYCRGQRHEDTEKPFGNARVSIIRVTLFRSGTFRTYRLKQANPT